MSSGPHGEDEPDTFTELSFAFTPLLTVLTVRQNSCRGIRGTISTHSFWEATGQSPTLALQLAQSHYRSAGTDTSTREWFTLSSQAPRVAEQFAQVCEVSDTPDGGTTCTTTRTRFDAGYLRQDDSDGGTP